MDSKIQPILCCVGDAVAGRPTQFLMERAFDAAHCDWRVITVEVQQADFQTALDGMRAMKFTALRFFPEFQQLAASLMLEQPTAPFAAVTSVMRQGQGWDCWDSQGLGLLELITHAAPASSTLLWLHGVSRLTHSLLRALQVSEYAPGRLLWSDAEDTAQLRPGAGIHESAIRESGAEELSLRSAASPLSEVQQTLQEILSQPNTFTHVAVVGEALADQLPSLSRVEVSGEIDLLLATNQLLTRQQVNQAWPRGKVTVLSESDQLLAAEAYDFRRWAGQPADIDLLRDAFDEYADF